MPHRFKLFHNPYRNDLYLEKWRNDTSGLDNQIIRMLVHSSNQYIKEKSEVAEAKKEGEVTVLDSPAKLFYAIIGIIGGLIFLGGTVWAWHDGERGWVIWVFLLFVLLGV